MGKEIELKLEVPPQELPRLKRWRALSRKGAGKQDLVSVYFDTPKHTLGPEFRCACGTTATNVSRPSNPKGPTAPSDAANGSTRLRAMCPIFARRGIPRLRRC